MHFQLDTVPRVQHVLAHLAQVDTLPDRAPDDPARRRLVAGQVHQADEIVAANPVSSEIREARERPAGSGMDWGRVLNSALIGAVIAGIAALVGGLARKRRRGNSD